MKNVNGVNNLETEEVHYIGQKEKIIMVKYRTTH